MVELTIALHAAFDTPRDQLVWDVGHQGYPHKVLTGRNDRMETLRQEGGLSGFLKRSESEYDAFGAGHAGTAISAALGMAAGRDLLGESYRVVAIVGDGALTCGLAYEGLNNAGHSGRDIIVVLNDNEMSIAPNVGAISKYLNSGATQPALQPGARQDRRGGAGTPRRSARWCGSGRRASSRSSRRGCCSRSSVSGTSGPSTGTTSIRCWTRSRPCGRCTGHAWCTW